MHSPARRDLRLIGTVTYASLEQESECVFWIAFIVLLTMCDSTQTQFLLAIKGKSRHAGRVKDEQNLFIALIDVAFLDIRSHKPLLSH